MFILCQVYSKCFNSIHLFTVYNFMKYFPLHPYLTGGGLWRIKDLREYMVSMGLKFRSLRPENRP